MCQHVHCAPGKNRDCCPVDSRSFIELAINNCKYIYRAMSTSAKFRTIKIFPIIMINWDTEIGIAILINCIHGHSARRTSRCIVWILRGHAVDDLALQIRILGF